MRTETVRKILGTPVVLRFFDEFADDLLGQ
jgi:hypothetical protein